MLQPKAHAKAQPRTPRKPKPRDYAPPFPGFNPDFPPSLPFVGYAHFGVQCRSAGADPRPALAALYAELKRPGGAEVIEQGWSVHGDPAASAIRTHLVYAYWRSPGARDAWMDAALGAAWWSRSEAAGGPMGLWVEAVDIDTRRTECLYVFEDHKSGYAHFCGKKPGQYHGYYGSLRHRIPAGDEDDFEQTATIDFSVARNGDTLGRRLEVTAPKNIVLIRTSQDWSKATAWEREYYLNDVEKHLIHAAHALDGDPDGAGCFYAYFVRETDRAGNPLERTNVTALFRSLDDLETWTWHHPDHKAIFDAAMEMVRRGQGQLMLNLWAEVSVLPRGVRGRYANCLPSTGLLSYFEARAFHS